MHQPTPASIAVVRQRQRRWDGLGWHEGGAAAEANDSRTLLGRSRAGQWTGEYHAFLGVPVAATAVPFFFASFLFTYSLYMTSICGPWKTPCSTHQNNAISLAVPFSENNDS